MNDHSKKMIAPIIIAVIMLIYFVGFVVLCFMIPEMPFWIKLLMVVVPLAIAGVTIFVLVERIKEIRSGEEDDLSKY